MRTRSMHFDVLDSGPMVTTLGRDHLWSEGSGAAPPLKSPRDVRMANSGAWMSGDVEADAIPTSVRPLGIRDIPRLRMLDTLHAVNQPDALVLAHHPLHSAVRSAIPGQRGKRPAFIAESGERIIGFVGFRAELPDGRWALQTLGASVGVYPAAPVWERILEYAVQQAGLRGVRSLHARIPWGVGASDSLVQAGWSIYASETIFQTPDTRPPGRPLIRPRLQEPADTWAIHQLYCAITPRSVQQAEAFTSRRWELPAGRPRRAPLVRGWVFEADSTVFGYVRALSGRRSSAIEVLIHPDRRDLAGPIIDGTLFALGDHGGRRSYCTIRGYQSELARPLQEKGFAASFEQELLVRYTTATVRRAVVESVPFSLDVRERVPQRAPTFLQDAQEGGNLG